MARLSASKFADKFVFKGGNLLSYLIELGRETKDLDFLMKGLRAEEVTLTAAFEAIASIEANDGFVLRFVGMQQLKQSHMQCPSFPITIEICFSNGRLKDKIQIDLGIGDVVHPEKKEIELLKYKDKALFEANLLLLVYPTETIFAEKLETIISKGPVNSRMKDYHDLVLMCREFGLLERVRMKSDILATFKNRGTDPKLPIYFSDSDYDLLEPHWLRHLRGLGELAGKLKLPPRIKQVVLEVNDFLKRYGVFEDL